MLHVKVNPPAEESTSGKTLVKSRNSPLKLCGELFQSLICLVGSKLYEWNLSSFISRFGFTFLRRFTGTTAGPDITYSGELSVHNWHWLLTGLCSPALIEKLWKLGRVSNFVYQSTPIKNKIRSLKCRNFKLWSCFIALYILLQMKHLRTKTNSSSVTCNRSCNTFYSFSCISEFVKISCKRRLFANAGQALQNE